MTYPPEYAPEVPEQPKPRKPRVNRAAYTISTCLLAVSGVQLLHAFSAYEKVKDDKATITNDAPGKTYDQAISDAQGNMIKSIDPYFVGTIAGDVNSTQSTMDWSAAESGFAFVGSILVLGLARKPEQPQAPAPEYQQSESV
jgi:hypothetical protein